MRLQLSTGTVREWTRLDAESLVRHANNPRVSMHLRDRFPYPYGPEHAEGFIEWAARQSPQVVWAIEVEGEAAGGIGVEPGTDVERTSIEIGYWLGEAHWGRGIATEALRAVTAEVFATFDVTRIFALPFADNPGSIRVLEKAGYTLEGRLRQSAVKHGCIKDQLLFATYRTP